MSKSSSFSIFFLKSIPAVAVAVVDNAVVVEGVDAVGGIDSVVVADAVVAVESHTSFEAVELDVLVAEAADTSLAVVVVAAVVALVLFLDNAVQAQP